MNRLIFCISLLFICSAGYWLIEHQVQGSGLMIMAAVTILVTLRRKKLDLRPHWGGLLRDIPNYFKKP